VQSYDDANPKRVIVKTTDGGASWDSVFVFGNDVNSHALGFEISRSQPDVLYLFQRAAYSWDPGLLWKTIDGGQHWSTLPLPPGYARRMVITLSPEDENLLWIAYPDGDNGQKVYKSTDGGQQWQNLSTPALNDEHISYILHQGGTDGGVYLGTYRTIWYRDDAMGNWLPYNDGLPKSVATDILRPFYRDGKLRLGAYGKGIWEAPFATVSRPVAQPMVNKMETSCPGDTLQFDDFSMLSHAGATWYWEFPGGVPASSDLRNPRVVYAAPGEYDVRLTVANPSGSSSKTVQKMIRVLNLVANQLPVVNDFSGGLSNLTILNPDGGLTWEPVNITGCDLNGDTAYYVHNYVYGGYGQDEILLPVNLDLTQIQYPVLKFRVAYAPYYDGNAFIDSLKVLLSADCGNSFTAIFRSGGEALSTTTSGSGNNNLYEYDEFLPANCNEWRTITLDLSAYSGQYVTIKFLNQSGYGNNMYLDDIALTGNTVSSVTNPAETFSLLVQPNPTRQTALLQGMSPGAQSLDLHLYNSTGSLLWHRPILTAKGPWSQPLDMQDLPTGVFWLTISDLSGQARSLKIVKTP